jgi:hypothetical protein
MKQYNIIHPLYMSFYSRDLYRSVAKDWSTGLCLLYLLSTVALCWIPGIMRVDADLKYYLQAAAPQYIAQMPQITITKGKASIAEKEPYTIKNPDSGDPAMIIDTTGNTKTLANSRAVALVTQNHLIIRQETQEQPVVDFADIDELTITKSLVHEWLEVFSDWFAVIAYPFAVVFGFIRALLQVLLYSVVGAIFSRFVRAGLTWILLVKVCSVALTPLLILNALTLFFRIDFPYQFFVNASIATGYLIFAIRSSYPLAPQA